MRALLRRAFQRRSQLAWVCPTCQHHNPKGRMECRKCRRARPLGA